MPVEIRKLVITTKITETEGEPAPQRGRTGQDPEDIIAECVEQVMEILREQNER